MKFCVKCGAIMRSTSAGIYVCPSCGNIQKDVPAEKPKSDPGVDKSAKSAKPAADKPEARKTPSAPVKKDKPASPTAANSSAAAPAAKAGRACSLNTDIGAEKEDKAQADIKSGDENPEKAAAVTAEKTTEKAVEKAAEKAVESEIAAPKPEKTEPAAANDTAPKEAKTTDDNTAAETAPESGDSATSADTNAELEAMRAKLRALEAEKELAETKAKLLEAEKKLNSGRSGGGSFSSALNSVKNSAAVVKARAVANKVGIGRLVFIFVILIAFITLMSCFCGLRGIYVNTNNPNEFYSFNSSHGYEYYYTNPLTGEPAVEKGRWSKSGDVLTLKTEDELFGNVEESFVLKDSSWSKFTLTESFMGIETETDFERVSVIQYKDNVYGSWVYFRPNYPTATVHFDGYSSHTSIGTDDLIKERVRLGSVANAPDAPNTYESTEPAYVFRGWYTTTDGWKTGEGKQYSETDRIWEDTTFYANWENLDEHVVTLNASGGDVATSSVYVEENNSYTLPVPTRAGYRFMGWYTSYGGDEIRLTNSSGNSYDYWYIEQDTTAYAVWEQYIFNVTFNTNDGELPNGETNAQIEIDTSYSLPIPVREHYRFTGWYANFEGEAIRLTNETGNSTRSWYIEQDTTVYATWEQYIFNVTFNTNDGELPNGETNAQIEINRSYTLPVPVREHYQFMGWYTSYNGEAIRLTTETGNSTSSWYIEQDTTVYATWEEIVYKVTYELNGGTNAAYNPSEYTILTLGSDGAIRLSSPTKTGGDISYTSNSDGTFDVTREAYTFEGWYLNSEFTGNAVTEITVDMGNVTLHAKWSESTTTTTTTEQIYTRSGSTIYFGEYPQTEVTDGTITTALNGMRGTLPTSSNSYDWTSYGYYISGNVTNFMWYIDLEYSGEKYRGVYFTSYRPYEPTLSGSTSYSYQDDNGYCTGMAYWFKYEPIKWRILTESDGKAMILSELILDSQQYDYESGKETYGNNNYAESTIRAWLNDTFYNTAFGALQQAIIETTEVDNSVYSTGSSSNPYACQNTFDKVFLLSYREANNSSYGMTSTTRQKQGSDYCKAQGSLTSTYSGNVGNGWWWLRSPHYNFSYSAWRVGANDDLGNGNNVLRAHMGVVPALVISL